MSATPSSLYQNMRLAAASGSVQSGNSSLTTAGAKRQHVSDSFDSSFSSSKSNGDIATHCSFGTGVLSTPRGPGGPNPGSTVASGAASPPQTYLMTEDQGQLLKACSAKVIISFAKEVDVVAPTELDPDDPFKLAKGSKINCGTLMVRLFRVPANGRHAELNCDDPDDPKWVIVDGPHTNTTPAPSTSATGS